MSHKMFAIVIITILQKKSHKMFIIVIITFLQEWFTITKTIKKHHLISYTAFIQTITDMYICYLLKNIFGSPFKFY